MNLRALSADTASELDILRHDSYTLCMDSTQVSILKESNEVSLSSFLKCKNCRSLETKIGLEILSDLTHKTLERQLADKKVSRLLVTTNLTKSYGSWTVTVRLLYSSGCGGRLTCSLGCELFTRSLSSGGFTCGLLGTGHFHEFVWFVRV